MGCASLLLFAGYRCAIYKSTLKPALLLIAFGAAICIFDHKKMYKNVRVLAGASSTQNYAISYYIKPIIKLLSCIHTVQRK